MSQFCTVLTYCGAFCLQNERVDFVQFQPTVLRAVVTKLHPFSIHLELRSQPLRPWQTWRFSECKRRECSQVRSFCEIKKKETLMAFLKDISLMSAFFAQWSLMNWIGNC